MRRLLFAFALVLPVDLLAAQDRAPAGAPLGGGRRLTHAEWAALPTPDGASFATGVIGYSSQFATSGWSATEAVGAPNVYPRYGDLKGAWAPATTTAARDVLSLAFSGAATREIWVFETFGVGGLYEVHDISDGGSVLLWRASPGPVAPATAVRVLRITLPQPRPISALQLVVSAASVGASPEVDAVAIVPTLAGPLLVPPDSE